MSTDGSEYILATPRDLWWLAAWAALRGRRGQPPYEVADEVAANYELAHAQVLAEESR